LADDRSNHNGSAPSATQRADCRAGRGKPFFVETLVNDLSSLLYRDEGADGAIRIRHLSISEFFASNRCDYPVDLQAAHVQQGVACLQTMVKQLCFNICKLEDSRLGGTLDPATPRSELSPLDRVSGYYSVCTSGRVGGAGDWLENAHSVIPSPVRENPK